MKLGDFLKDHKGKPSSQRLAMFLFLVAFLVVFVRAGISTSVTGIPDIPEGVRWLFGILFTTTVGQKYIEKKSP